jgi:putative portal protein
LFSRNAILTPNEIRQFIGKEPHPNPLADQLYNRNIADGNQMGGIATAGQGADPATGEDDPSQYVYQDENGNFVDYQGNPVDEAGNPIRR